jgi:hypothetical protein
MATTKNKKGQATIEYLVLLAVAIIIALVIFAFMGWVPGFAGSLKERQVRLFWSSQFPIQIRDYKVTTTGSQFMLQNVGDSKIQIMNFSASGVNDTALSPSGNSAQLAAGQEVVFTSNLINCSSSGSGNPYELTNITIGYNVLSGISNMIEGGDRPLTGRCQ